MIDFSYRKNDSKNGANGQQHNREISREDIFQYLACNTGYSSNVSDVDF